MTEKGAKEQVLAMERLPYAFFILLLSVYRKPVPASFVTHFCIQKGHLPKSASVPTIFL